MKLNDYEIKTLTSVEKNLNLTNPLSFIELCLKGKGRVLVPVTLVDGKPIRGFDREKLDAALD